MPTLRNIYIVATMLAILSSCTPMPTPTLHCNTLPPIVPDYCNTTVPINLAPVRFALPDTCHIDNAWAIFRADNQEEVVPYSNQQFAISARAWNRLKKVSDSVSVEIRTTNSDGICTAYCPFSIYISPDKIDSYLVYRLIEPGYEVWNKMGIYQRCLEDYDETPIITNEQTAFGCLNCHSFCQNNPEQMLFHARANYGATYIINNGKNEKLNTKTPQTISPLVYPAWHPSGKFVAFSTNATKQMFHTVSQNRIEVFDSKSDVVVYDVENHTLFASEQTMSDDTFETFPTFSPDGKRLFFCSAPKTKMPQNYADVHYSLCSVSFDAENKTIGRHTDTLYNATAQRGSVSLPRISPNGKWLMFVRAAYGNFSIWHTDADLYLLSLTDSIAQPFAPTGLNSELSESYHSWSSNSKWVVFSSRRTADGYTRPYIAHIADDGECTKPFVVPQADARFYDRLMKSYNIPELVSNKVTTTGHDLRRIIRSDDAIQILFNQERK